MAMRSSLKGYQEKMQECVDCMHFECDPNRIVSYGTFTARPSL